MRATAGSVTNAMIRISPSHCGQVSTSTWKTRRRSSAHRRLRARSAGQSAAGCGEGGSGSGAGTLQRVLLRTLLAARADAQLAILRERVEIVADAGRGERVL